MFELKLKLMFQRLFNVALLSLISFSAIAAENYVVNKSVASRFKLTDVSDKMTLSLNTLLLQSKEEKTLSINDFHQQIAIAVSRHPDLRSVAEQAQTASYVTREAFGAYLPQVSAISDVGSRLTNRMKIGTIEPIRDGIDVNVNLKQLLYDFGATSANYNAAKFRELAVAERLSTKRSETALRAVNAYFELIRARQLSALAADNFDSRLSIVNMVKERFELGGGSKVDVIRAEARLTDASAAKISADISLNLAEASYKEAFGEAPGLTPTPQDVSIDFANQPIEDLTAKYGAVRETKLQLEGSRADVSAANARMLPTLNLELNGGRKEQETYNGPYLESSAHVIMRYNLFTGGQESARKGQAIHRAEQAEQDLQNLILQVNKSITQSVAQVNGADNLVKSRLEGVAGASESLLLVKEYFAYKRGTLLDLLRSQEELYTAGRDFISASVDRSIARYRLLHLAAALETMIPDASDNNF